MWMFLAKSVLLGLIFPVLLLVSLYVVMKSGSAELAIIFPAVSVFVVWLLAKLRQFLLRNRPNVVWGVFSYRENWTLGDSLFVIGAMFVAIGSFVPTYRYPGDDWADRAMPQITFAVYVQEQQVRTDKYVKELFEQFGVPEVPEEDLQQLRSQQYMLWALVPMIEMAVSGDAAKLPLQVTLEHAAKIKAEAAKQEGKILLNQMKVGSYILLGLVALGFVLWQGKKLLLLAVAPIGLASLDRYLLGQECAAFAVRVLSSSSGKHAREAGMDQVILAGTLESLVLPGPAVVLFVLAALCFVSAAVIRK